jgi:ArsR family metal-binding transcriptional regulator
MRLNTPTAIMNSDSACYIIGAAQPADSSNECISEKIPEGRGNSISESITETTQIQIIEFSKLLTCLGDPSKFRMVARLHTVPGDLIETLEPLFEKAVYSRRMNALLIKMQSTIITIYASGIVTMTRLGNEDQARELLNNIIGRINRYIEEGDLKSLRNECKSRKRLDPMELTAYLPRTNCTQCGVKSCFYFSTMLAFSETTLGKCKLLQDPCYSANRDALERLISMVEVK